MLLSYMDVLPQILTGLTIGFISSFHCVGMCGAIAFSLPVHYLPSHLKLLGIVAYNLGRVCMYALLGLFFGFVGKQFFIGGFQQVISVILGVVILVYTLLSTSHLKSKSTFRFIQIFHRFLENNIAVYIQQKHVFGMFMVGILNGLLPCGMVYFAVTGAMAVGSVEGGVGFMAAFGIGTLPTMLSLSYFGFLINIRVRNLMKQSIPFFIAAMAVLLILRGLNLNIPYVSPQLTNMAEKVIPCH